MPVLSHSSFRSSQDKNGHCHYVSIDRMVWKQTEKCSICQCCARSCSGSQDPRNGAILLAKFLNLPADLPTKQMWADCEVAKSTLAQEKAVIFNHTIRHMEMIKPQGNTTGHSHAIEFLLPQISHVDQACCGSRKRKENEPFILLDQLENFETFVCRTEKPHQARSDKKKKTVFNIPKRSKSSRNFSSAENISSDRGNVTSRRRYQSEGDIGAVTGSDVCTTSVIRRRSKTYCEDCRKWTEPTRQYVSHQPHGHLHAFVHHFYSMTQGHIAIDCLKGSHSPWQGYTLTVPTLHSRDQRFGMDDQGLSGMADVIDSHTCSDLCRHLPPMTLTSSTHATAAMFRSSGA